MTTQRTPLMDISNNDATSSPAPTEGRRKSGRAVKAPEKFVPTTQPENPSAKRKRSGENEENDASDGDDLTEESEDEIESAGEEEVQETRKKPKSKAIRKPAAKKPKVNGTASHSEPPAVRLPTRPKKTRKRGNLGIADEGEGLFAQVFGSDGNFEDIISQWLADFKQDGPTALADLVNFLLKSAGCDIEVTSDDINDVDNADSRVGDIQGEYQETDIVDYPLISKKSGHAFRTSFVGFIEYLIEGIHGSELMYKDTTLLDNIHVWVAPMTTSNSRPIRHTSTLAALTITSTLCRIGAQQINTAADALRQFESEGKKKGTNKARLAEFRKNATINESRKLYIEKQLKEYFNTIYVNRYRDVDVRIRLECAEALGTWMLTLPSYFFEAQFLRYMGWMLSDTHGPMRHEVVKQLAKIMRNPERHGGMRHFIERFRSRMIEMATNDSESSVRAAAVELADTIRQAGFLEPDDIDIIGKLIFDSDPKVRKALVNFFTENVQDLYEAKVDELGGEEALEDFLNTDDDEDSETPRAGWIRFKSLAEMLLSYDSDDQEELPSQMTGGKFLNASGIESRFSLVTQVLYDKLPGLKEWENLASYLLFDHTSTSTANQTEQAFRATFKPEEKEELILLDVLNAVVAIILAPHDDTDKSKKKPSKAETAAILDSTARKLISIMPRLLKKYGADPKTAAKVLQLEHHLDLEIFQELRQGNTGYAQHLDGITSQFKAHGDNAVLDEAGAALLHARRYEDLEEVTQSKLDALWEDVISNLRSVNKVGEISVRGGFRTKPLNDLSINLARLLRLSQISSPVEYLEAEADNDDSMPIAILLDVIARGVYEETSDESLDVLEDEVVVSAIQCGLFYFMWKVRQLTSAINAGEEIADLDVDQLREWQETFTQNLTAAFSSRSTLDTVRLLGAGTILDLHSLFASVRPPKGGKGKSAATSSDDEYAYLQTLSKEIIPEVQAEITSIFDALEKHYAKRTRKRLTEPGEDEEPEDPEEEPEDNDEDDGTDGERQNETLKAEKELCDLAGKIVLGIMAGIIDASGPLKGKLRTRILRNRSVLGSNVKGVLAYLDDPKSKSKKSHKSKAGQAAAASKKNSKSTVLVVEDDEEEEEEEDPFVNEEPEEGTAEDLRARELVEEDVPVSEAGESESAQEDEDEIMGD